MRLKGKLTSWDSEKGFGFITPVDGGKRLFIHISELNDGWRRPQINQSLSYIESVDDVGRSCAEQARLEGGFSLSGLRKLFQPMVLACVFLLTVAIATYFNVVPLFILILYGVMSLITFVFYALDKSAARKGRWRTSENTLHLLALLGGWPGAVLAQQKLRHKSSKTSFRLMFWMTVVVNLALFYWLCTPMGRNQLGSVFSFMI